MTDVDGFERSVVFGRDAHSLIAWTCLMRPSDGHFSVGFVERIPFEGDWDKNIAELPTPIEQLKFTTEDAAIWEWRANLQEAVDVGRATFAAALKIGV